MGLPKRRFSRSRRDKRRTQIHLRTSAPSKCAHCGATVLSHRICPACGYYRGRQVVSIEEKSKVKPVKNR